MASTIGFAAFPGCVTKSFDKLLDALPARERRLFLVDAEMLKKDVAEGIHAIESV